MGGCADIEMKCPYGEIMTIGQCYAGFGCETCTHLDGTQPRYVQNRAWSACNMDEYLKCGWQVWEDRADGCSDPTGIYTGSDFIEVCDMHDLCYASGQEQDFCDYQFWDNIWAATGDAAARGIMYAAVRNHASSEPVEWGINNCRKCDESLSGSGQDYRGCQSKTISGRTCQIWDSWQYTHPHSFTSVNYPDAGLGEHNRCRNPDGDSTIWCFTTDPDVVWEYCNPDSSLSSDVQQPIPMNEFKQLPSKDDKYPISEPKVVPHFDPYPLVAYNIFGGYWILHTTIIKILFLILTTFVAMLIISKITKICKRNNKYKKVQSENDMIETGNDDDEQIFLK